MSRSTVDSSELKEALKQALVETLNEQRELLQEVFAEVPEEAGMAEAIREGRQTERVSREDVIRLLEDQA